MIKRRSVLKALVLGSAMAFPIARITLSRPEYTGNQLVNFRFEWGERWFVAGTDLFDEVVATANRLPTNARLVLLEAGGDG